MYDTLTFYTFLALIIFYVSIEIYRVKFFIKGTIVEFCHSDLGIDEFILTRMKVELRSGQLIEAEASQCTMCMGNLSVGDEVSLLKKNERYLVNLSFKMKRKLGNRNNCQSTIIN